MCLWNVAAMTERIFQTFPGIRRCVDVHTILSIGPALMAMWSKVLSLTASCLSPLSGFESHPRHVTKLPATLVLAVLFGGYSGFLHQLQMVSHD